ncbi:hypothetical protein H7686_0001705 [Candidatus Phytoplasma asiaticum]|uniref:Effector n=2 Tax=Candidatus Phytoplasma asiaticum TaxID=2763338 RepID=A0AAX3B8R3_9MOLU|nr:hypothetical protein ['Parthenium hysterophorus' phyllody phytoplasma]UQV27063.1 hypothetical protein H7686_0001705 ['Parthenium hysterophorus' phyllody phytoplasma]
MLKKIQLKFIIFLLLNLVVVNFFGLFINKQGNLSNSKLSNVKAFFDINWNFFSKPKKITKYPKLITEQSLQKKITEYGQHIENLNQTLINDSNKTDLFLVQIKLTEIENQMKDLNNKKEKLLLTTNNYSIILDKINIDLENLKNRINIIQFRENPNNPKKSDSSEKEFFINTQNR